MTDMQQNKLKGKLLIGGTIEVLTGLAIGGSKSGIDIGALDNPVIKYRKGGKNIPYIPGSSLKGKMRALLAKAAGSKNETEDKRLNGDFKELANLFGYPPDDKVKKAAEGLLKVRDCFLTKESENITEEKMENSIDRVNGKANPRPLERVLPGTVFNLDLCLDVYDISNAKDHLKLIDLAFALLNEDYLGGGGTRGNGKVKVDYCMITYKEVDGNNGALKERLDSFESELKKCDESKNTETTAG